MNFFENITFRHTQTRSDTTINNDSVSITETQDMATNSMPDISDDEDELIQNLRDKVKTQALQLISAHKEIEVLSLEITNLKCINKDLLMKNELLKKITISPTKHTSPTTTPKKRSSPQKTSKQNTVTKPKEQKKSQTTSTQIQTNILPVFSDTTMEINNTEVTNIHKYAEKKRNTRAEIRLPQQHKPNMCILSANKQNKVLSIAEDTTMKQYNLCHYLTPEVGIRELLKGIHTKLADYTRRDYCVIFIGEDDFKISINYSKLVSDIRNTLNAVTHTNIIICLPTYKYNTHSNMYNWRVRNFNHILYNDVSTHKYAYVLDSNADITYDFNSFYRRSGKLNNFGMESVFMCLISLINDIQYFTSNNVNNNIKVLTTHEPTYIQETNNQLFR